MADGGFLVEIRQSANAGDCLLQSGFGGERGFELGGVLSVITEPRGEIGFGERDAREAMLFDEFLLLVIAFRRFDDQRVMSFSNWA